VSNLHRIDLTNAWDAPTTMDGPWVRRFGCPTGLARADRVWLVSEVSVFGSDEDRAGIVRPRECRLNGTPLPALLGPGLRRADVTHLLRPRNELVLVADVTGQAEDRRRLPDDVGRVWLEIETTG